MRNLLNCHSKGLHSFPISLENGLYRRIFHADESHNLWRTSPIELAIHPHHVDIKITVLDGILFNLIYRKNILGSPYKAYKWDSVIRNGEGGFTHVGTELLSNVSTLSYKPGESVTMQACELHTVYVPRGMSSTWIVEEAIPTCEYFPINYSDADLTNWTPEGLYQEVGDDVKEYYIGKYVKQLQND